MIIQDSIKWAVFLYISDYSSYFPAGQNSLDCGVSPAGPSGSGIDSLKGLFTAFQFFLIL